MQEEQKRASHLKKSYQNVGIAASSVAESPYENHQLVDASLSHQKRNSSDTKNLISTKNPQS